jgi:hypothetical protein
VEAHIAHAQYNFIEKFENFKLNMADTKISVDSKVLAILHEELKDDIKKKVKEKGWDENEIENVINGLLKV